MASISAQTFYIIHYISFGDGKYMFVFGEKGWFFGRPEYLLHWDFDDITSLYAVKNVFVDDTPFKVRLPHKMAVAMAIRCLVLTKGYIAQKSKEPELFLSGLEKETQK